MKCFQEAISFCFLSSFIENEMIWRIFQIPQMNFLLCCLQFRIILSNINKYFSYHGKKNETNEKYEIIFSHKQIKHIIYYTLLKRPNHCSISYRPVIFVIKTLQNHDYVYSVFQPGSSVEEVRTRSNIKHWIVFNM